AAPETAWSYTVLQSNLFTLSEDQNENYILIHCGDINRTIILNRDNGAYLTTIDCVLPQDPYLSEDNKKMFFLADSGLMKYDLTTGVYSAVLNKKGFLGRIENGKLTCVMQESAYKFCITKLDLNTEELERIFLPRLPLQNAGVKAKELIPVDMDCTGKVAFLQLFTDDTHNPCGYAYWFADPGNNSVVNGAGSEYRVPAASAGFVKDEEGKAKALYQFHIRQTSANHAKPYGHLFVSEINDSGAAGAWRTIYTNVVNHGRRGIIYAQYHQSENAVYITQGSEFDGVTGIDAGAAAKISLPSWSAATGVLPPGWDNLEEAAEPCGGLVKTCYINTGLKGGENRVKLYNYPMTKEQSAIRGIRKQSETRAGIKSYLASVSETGEPLSQAVRELAEKLSLNEITARIADIAEDIPARIKESIRQGDPMLHLSGNAGNIAKAWKEVQLQPSCSYQYTYSLKTSGPAVDLFSIRVDNLNPAANESLYYKEAVDAVNYALPGASSPYITTYTSGFGNEGSSYPYPGIATGLRSGEQQNLCSFSVYLAKPGYVEFDYYSYLYGSGAASRVLVNGGTGETNPSGGHRLIYFPAGTHTISFYSYGVSVIGFTNVQIGYLYSTDQAASPNGSIGSRGTVTGTFEGPRQLALKKTKLAESVISTDATTYLAVSSGANISKGPNYVFLSSKLNIGANGLIRINAPADKMMFVSFDYGVNSNYAYSTATVLGNAAEMGRGRYLIPPGGYWGIQTRNMQCSSNGGSSVYVTNIQYALLTSGQNGLTINTPYITGDLNVLIKDVTLNGSQPEFIEIRNVSGSYHFSRVSDAGACGGTRSAVLALTTEKAGSNFDGYLSDFLISIVSSGQAQQVHRECFFSQREAESSGWSFSGSGDSFARIESPPASEEEEDPPLVYKKGQLVAYTISYDDYENDPSKRQYW
ncbi:MAG: hypothetical protein PHC91_11245, partial [Eubacteriales bacterium]|nr:hypothetical protein [Eubacteriales bacterium]